MDISTLYIPFVVPRTIDPLPPFLCEIVPPIRVISYPFRLLNQYPVSLIVQPARNPSPPVVRCYQEFLPVIHSLFVRELHNWIKKNVLSVYSSKYLLFVKLFRDYIP